MSDMREESWRLTRRKYLELGALGAAAAPLLGSSASAAPAASATGPERKRVLRFAHLTDIHLQPERAAAAGTAACLHHVQGLADPPGLIVTGGDTVFDVFEVDQARTDLLGKLWADTLKGECSLPVRSCIGNHDIRPWTAGDAVGAAAKSWASDLLHLERRYYGFDQAGWRFLVLDSVQPEGEGYVGYIDAEQRDWLEGELNQLASARPVVIVSHISILTVTPLLADQERYVEGEHRIAGAVMLRDSTSLHYLLREHPNVKLCLSGHMHLLDRCEADGVTYICGGAVSANWWQGRRQKLDEGYGLVDLYDDGSFDYAYTTYGWKAQA
jgi:3',5'-cyclic AMP phosphodiesterase CpdA